MRTKFKMQEWLLTENQIMCRIVVALVVALVYKHTFGALWTSIFEVKELHKRCLYIQCLFCAIANICPIFKDSMAISGWFFVT